MFQFLQSLLEFSTLFGWQAPGLHAEGGTVADSEIFPRLRSLYGPASTPRDLPSDLPVCSQYGYRQQPRAQADGAGRRAGRVTCRAPTSSLVCALYEEQLPAKRWLVFDQRSDQTSTCRRRRYDVQKGLRIGTVTVEESNGQPGSTQRSTVTVNVEITRWS